MGQMLTRMKFDAMALLAALAMVLAGLAAPQTVQAQEAEASAAEAAPAETATGYVPMAPTKNILSLIHI